MTDFLKRFLLEDPRRFHSSGRFVALGAFGKHPGWDDHVEDLGLETESLNLAKTTLYVNGIGGQIDSGAWEKLDAAQQVPAFQHVFAWQRSGQILLGRLWSSSDGKGRKRYPMVVCLHFMGVALAWALKQGLPVLADLEQACLNTTSAEEVRSQLARKRAALREAILSADAKGEYAPLTPDALHRILNPAGSNRDGFLRVLYQLHGQFGGFAPGTFSVRANPAVQQIRVPAAASGTEQAILFWTRFFLVFVDSSVPLLLTAPLEAEWVDVTAGEPESHEMFCLRANPKAVPLVSEVPYKLEPEFSAKAAAFLEAFQRGEMQRPNLELPRPPVPAAAVPAKGGFLKWLGFGLLLLLGGATAFWFSQKGGLSMFQARPPAAKRSTTAAGGKTEPAVSPTPKTAAPNAAFPNEAELARRAEEKKKADAVAAAQNLKAETEAAAREQEHRIAEAAAKEKQRLLDEAAAREKERLQAQAAEREKQRLADAAKAEAARQAALQKQQQEQQAKAAEAAAGPAPASAKSELASARIPATAAAAGGTAATAAPAHEMTNSIGMILVQLPSGLWVGKFEVTQAEYKRVMNANPSHPNWLGDLQPVQQVTWFDAVEFARKLTSLEQASLPAGTAYSLPTEKQWKEFAGSQKIEDMPGGSLTRKGPSPVGRSGPPNQFGLFDVLGNLWEWCLDDATGDQKVLKGGAFNSNNYDRTLRPDQKSVSCGFRCILVQADKQ